MEVCCRTVLVAGTLGLLVGSGALSGCQSGDPSSPRTVTLRGANHPRLTGADQLRRAGRYDEAIRRYVELLAEPSCGHSWDVLLRHGIAQSYWARAGRAGRPAQAVASDRSTAVCFAREALDLARGVGSEDGAELVAALGGTLGAYLVETGRIDEAIAHYDDLLDKHLAATTKHRVRTLHDLGNTLYSRAGKRDKALATPETYREDLDRAMATYESALQSAASIDDVAPTLLASIHNSRALIFAARFSSRQAVAEYTAAVEALEKTDNTQALGAALGNLITELAEAGQMEQVRLRYDQLKSLPGARSDPRLLAALGMADLKRGRFEDARAGFDLALHLPKRSTGETVDSIFITQVLCNAAACASEFGRFREADRFLRDAERRSADGGVDARTASIVLANRGRMYLTLERLNDAERVLETRLSTLRESQGARHPDTLMVLLDLAQLAQSRGLGSEALRRCEEAVEGLAEALGADHPTTAGARLQLASIQRDRDECALALRSARSAMAALDQSLGEEHKRSVLACLQATLIAADCRDTTEGAAAFDVLKRQASQRFTAMRSQLGADHVEVLRALVDFAGVSAKTSTAMAVALARYREAEQGFRNLMGDGGLTVASLRLRRSELLERMDKPDEALAVYERALGDLDRSLSGHLIRSQLLSSMGDVLMTRGEFEKAKSCWVTSVRILADLYGHDDPRVTRFKENRRR